MKQVVAFTAFLLLVGCTSPTDEGQNRNRNAAVQNPAIRILPTDSPKQDMPVVPMDTVSNMPVIRNDTTRTKAL